jgi:DNA polymerase III subunit beta
MKLICNQSELNQHLSLVSRVVPSRPSHPVLANVLLCASEENQQISLTGFDLSLGVQTSFGAQVEQAGKLTLPAKLLSDIVSRLPEGQITLDDSEDEMVTLTCSSGRYQMRGMGAEEFPELPSISEAEVTLLPVDALTEGLRGSLFATSGDESKQVLTGVHLTAEADGLEFAATDGHRLAVVQTVEADGEASGERSLDVTVPAKALRELERMIQINPGSLAVAVKFDQGQLICEWANQRLTSRLLEGQYPNYRQLIPRQFTRQMTVERRLFVGTLERIGVLADQKNSIVKLTLDCAKQEIVLSVEAQDVGNGREAIPAQISGEDLEIAFNVRYLLEGLKAFNTTDVQMQFNAATSPSVLNPVGGMKMTYLVMPVQVRS